MIDFENHAVFEPDAVLASQFFTPGTDLPEPERLLMVAVLEDAVRCLLNFHGATEVKKVALYREAHAWLMSTERTGLYAFENICDVLGIEAGYFRRQLLARRASARPPAPRRVAACPPAAADAVRT